MTRRIGYLLLPLLFACGGGNLPEPPPPVDLPALDQEELDAGEGIEEDVGMEVEEVAEGEAPAGEGDPPGEEPAELDPLLDSPWLDHPTLESRVDFWIEFWQGRGASDFNRYLERMDLYAGGVDELIGEMGLPPSLRYLPIVESGYNPVAVSPVGATGLWQFMAPTARWLGLSVTPLIDERRDPFASTSVALGYLVTLREQFDSWLLALAAYNSGPGRVNGLIRAHSLVGEEGDSVFRAIHPHLPPETRDFLPRFVAASRMAAERERYGFGDVERREPVEFDEVSVPDATSLDVVARAADVPIEEIERLNPQLLRGITPRGTATALRVPEGKGAVFAAAYALVPPEERVTFVEHRVRSGETLGHIAQRNGILLAELRAANPRVDPRRLQIGQRLIVPIAPTSGRSGVAPPPSSGGAGGGRDAQMESLVYRVVSGDTLGEIAARHGVRAEELARLNGLSTAGIIRPGDEIRIPVSR